MLYLKKKKQNMEVYSFKGLPFFHMYVLICLFSDRQLVRKSDVNLNKFQHFLLLNVTNLTTTILEFLTKRFLI